jgi:hypothetical protein
MLNFKLPDTEEIANLFCPLLKDYGSRINCEQSTTHKQTIRAKLTDIYAMERNYLSGPIK